MEENPSFLGITYTMAKRVHYIDLFFLGSSTMLIQILLTTFISTADDEHERADFLASWSSFVFSISVAASMIFKKLVRIPRGMIIRTILLLLLISWLISFILGLSLDYKLMKILFSRKNQ